MSSTLFADAVPSSSDRATGGRFAKNNPGGPGNPFARQTAALRAYLINHVTERDMQDILDILLLNAKGGHLPTIKFLFSYVLGKPKLVVEPDLLDLQEMHMLQQSALPPEALAALANQLPLPLLLQLLNGSQATNQRQATQEAQDAVAAEPLAECAAPKTAPSTNGVREAIEEMAPPAPPSINGDNGKPSAVPRPQRPSPNGKKERRPQLAGFDWLREQRGSTKGRPRA